MSKSKKQKHNIATFLALVAAETLWGINTSVIKLALRSVPLPFFLAVTLLGAALLLAPFAKKYWQPMKSKDYALLIIASLIGITLGNVVLLMGLKYVFAFTYSIISLLKPVLLIILSVGFLKEKFGWKNFWGIIIAFMGAAVIIWQPWQASSNRMTYGILLLILAALCDVIATVMIKPIASRYNSYQVTTLHLFLGATPIGVYVLFHLSSTSFKAMGTTGLIYIIVNTALVALASVLFYFGLKYRQVQKTGVFQYVNPIATLIGGWLLLNELPNGRLWLGAILVAAGIYLAEVSKQKLSRIEQVRKVFRLRKFT